MTGVNPFLEISPKREEVLFGIDITKVKDYAKLLAGGNVLVIVSGGIGSGKSVVEMKIEKELPSTVNKYKLVCSPGLSNDLKAFKPKNKNVIIIEKFHMILALGEKKIKEVLDTIGDMISPETSFLITSTPELAASIMHLSHKIRNVSVFDIQPLSLENTRKLIALKLNKKNTADLSPFTEKEVKHIWETSKGNPKMILLLCASLYEAKRNELR